MSIGYVRPGDATSDRSSVSGHGSVPSAPMSTRAEDPPDATVLDRALRSAGHRVTTSRRAVYATLLEADTHLTPDEVVERGGDRLTLATTYRVLALFDELGLARSTRLAGDGASWELAHPDDHVHLVCGGCGGVDHHVGDAVSRLRAHLLDDHGFAADEVDLVVRGRCHACGEPERDPPGPESAGHRDDRGGQ